MDTPTTVAFLHAHPDDEAIFTGGTMAMLAAQGHHVVLLVATSGERGVRTTQTDLGAEREQETLRCCKSLGVSDVRFLGFQDSGLHGDNPDGFVHTDAAIVVAAARRELASVGALSALVIYDDHGIYGHPDHVQVHKVGHQLAAELNIATVYESTVDREYLHFVETHVVVQAGLGDRPVGRGLAASDLGVPSLLVDLTVDASRVLDTKRQAMAAHTSQLPADAPAFALGQKNFAAVYGYEWYLRHGPPAALDRLPRI